MAHNTYYYPMLTDQHDVSKMNRQLKEKKQISFANIQYYFLWYFPVYKSSLMLHYLQMIIWVRNTVDLIYWLNKHDLKNNDTDILSCCCCYLENYNKFWWVSLLAFVNKLFYFSFTISTHLLLALRNYFRHNLFLKQMRT